MRSDDDPEFDDPALKAALRRAFADDRAPAHLRGRIELALASAGPTLAPDAGTRRTGWARWRDTVYASVAAAVLLIGIGLLVLEYQGALRSDGPGGGSSQYAADTGLPPVVASAMVDRHDGCTSAGHATPIPLASSPASTSPAGPDLDAVRTQLTAAIGFPMLIADPGGDWTFRGAGTCGVGSVTGGHLLFTRGPDSISVFALPAKALYKAPDGAEYTQTVRDHPVSGFKRGKGLYCVVGTRGAGGQLTLADVVALRQQLQGPTPAANCASPNTLARLGL